MDFLTRQIELLKYMVYKYHLQCAIIQRNTYFSHNQTQIIYIFTFGSYFDI